MKYKKSDIAAKIVAPEIDIKNEDDAGDILLNFYPALGWNGEDNVDPRRVRTTKAVYTGLLAAIKEKCPNNSAGEVMVNWGPGVDDNIPHGKVYLLKGWTGGSV